MFNVKFFIFILLSLFLSACSSNVSVQINNLENSNLNNRFDDVPITVIVYQLKDIKKFEEASDLDLATREDGVLGKDKIDSIKLQIAPKDKVIAVKVNDEEVPYIGVLALFANHTKKTTKIGVKTEEASGFGSNKILKFEISKEGIKKSK
ncbi:type VI secretion system lipoprotein TssJ [Campylobacter sp. US33a]|uniref:Type VI secretion system lipoprotein TssJ n=1 Tax=Campylobacter sp. CCS1377 TaxID=3158229 RepID=A0AAU7E993_9BACT|nr:type VI secretion system lipoprotein TssJ [Campylobacter sp. US33a]MCW1360956.1 type VI secretion system lipoprotein TssJ [Campylobacter jejuni]TEY00218.1 type VI secretion system lipoprotein TssJ [Campylobacter sp. US33a]